MTDRAVVLLSGGLDSATCLAWARGRGFECHSLAIDYGQRHRVELEAAKRVSRALGARGHREVRVDLRAIGGSALTTEIEVPKDRSREAIATGIPVTYVPARNTVFLALARSESALERPSMGINKFCAGVRFWPRIAVGTPIAGRPPHRSVRAEFPHTAPIASR